MQSRSSAREQMPAPLRRDVRLLGDVLGQVLTESGGADLLADVERLRHAVIEARGGGDADAPTRVVDGLSLERAHQVAHAFTVYFLLANLAEERQRVRALRAGGDAPPRWDSYAGVLAELGPDELGRMLTGLRVHPVLTAHPTEARRRAVLTAVRRIGEQLDRLDDPRTGAVEAAEARRRLLEEVAVLWATASVRRNRPGPLDEVRAVMAVFDETLFRMVPAVYRAFDVALAGAASGAQPPVVPAFLRYGSWVGGDRDGNPNVTAATTRAVLDVHAEHVLRALAAAATRIGRTLTLDAAVVRPAPALRAALQGARDAHPDLLAELETTSPDEPHRAFLLLVAARLDATRRRDADLGYPGPDALAADLRLLQDSLAAAGARRVAFGEVQHLIWQVQTFGFHLAELEVRQHSAAHRAALEELGVEFELGTLDALALDGEPVESDHEVLATLRAVAALQRRWGARACHRYVVSFTRGAADLVAVRALGRLAAGGALELDVVPLFETEQDLQASVDVLAEWVATASTRRRLEANGGRLEVMLGYSDSAKDVGPVSATFALYQAQERLAAWARGQGITLTLFHGRGGALGRGGGPAGRAVRSSAPGSLAGRFKVTEQGEVIAARYGHLPIALRHVEQVSAAVLLASTPRADEATAAAAQRFAPLAARVGAAARDAYRALVSAPGFAAFVARATPLEEIGALQIGSRPSRRSAGGGLAELRAIPWVFAWSQTRANLPGWYGLGSGLAAALAEPGGAEQLRAAYREWPLFESMLDNVEMSLAKADRGIAERYLQMGADAALAERILAELDRTHELVLQVTGHDRLLAQRPVLARAVELRNPYVDALSHLQLRALRGLRAGVQSAEAARLREVLLVTINGIAAGLQNTG